MEQNSNSGLRIVMVGPPGGGKGTQARLLQERLNVPHISTGEIFRAYAKAGTDIGLQVKQVMDAGELVSDELTLAVIEDKLFATSGAEQGFILDGFPRTLPQAESFEKILESYGARIDAVINIKVPDEYIIERITGRFSCAKCGAMYHEKFKRTKIKGICDECGGTKFIRRIDDTEEVVKERLKNYRALTEPLLPFYEERKVLFSVNGVGEIEEVAGQIEGVIGEICKNK